MFYIAVGIVYVFFNKLIINYRPVLTANELEASYPSSHTLLVLCIMSTAMIQMHQRIKNQSLRTILDILCVAVMFLTVIGRLLAGVHWISDIIGGILISAALVTLYYAVINRMAQQKKQS